MLRAKPSPSPKPTWQVHARPIGATHEPWQTLRVEARSSLQAEAMLRRRGYEMVLQTAMRVPAPGEALPLSVALRPIVCERCGYGLTGLVINESSVTCPECSFPQPLVAWSPEVASWAVKPSVLVTAVVWVFAVIGMISVAFVLLVFVAAALSY